MKLSQLIFILEKAKEEKGDIQVLVAREDYEGRLLFTPTIMESEYAEDRRTGRRENPYYADDEDTTEWKPCIVIESEE